MQYDRQVIISTAGNRKSKIWLPQRSWISELIERLKTPVRSTETLQEYLKMSKSKQDDLKDVGGFVAGSLRGNKRGSNTVIGRDIITLDLDNIPSGGTQNTLLRLEGLGCGYAVYSTRKHEPVKPRLRVLLPLNRTCTADEYEPIARKIASIIGIELCDPTTFQSSRLMYWPSCCIDSQYVFQFGDRPFLDADGILNLYTDWRNIAEWAQVPGAPQAQVKLASKQGDPTEKSGVVGAFCKIYDIYKAIDTFIPDAYTPCDMDDRLTYTGGSTTAGAIIYDNGKFLYSHHATDPAGGKLCNAFDLIRLHKFGELDEDAKPDTPTNKLPSYVEMCKLAVADPSINDAMVKEQLKQVQSEFSEVLNEIEDKDYLYLNKNGVLSVNCSRLAIFIKNNCKYLIVRKQGVDNEIRYWYDKGYYKQISPNEFKGKIKEYIPSDIRKPQQWEDVYKHLITNSTATSFNDLDPCEHLICFKNGVYDAISNRLIDFNPDYLQSIQLNAAYNPAADEPKIWLKFIDSLANGDDTLKLILQEWAGLTISNYNGYRPKKALAMYGIRGNTGKTQYLNIITDIIGIDNICSTPIQKLSDRFGSANAYGKRAVIIDEQKPDNIENSTVFKAMTGGGNIEIELKGKQSFSYIFRGTITFSCNDLPYFKGDKGDHLWERFIVFPCNRVIAPRDRDPQILDKMKKEKDSIVQWALNGLHRLISNDFRFTYSERAAEALDEYRQSNDSLYRFIKEGYLITHNSKDVINKKVFEDAYCLWCSLEGYNSLDRKNIQGRAAKHGIECKRMSDTFYYRGIRELKKEQ